MIHFNKPYTTGDELSYIEDAINRGHLSGNGYYSKQCELLLKKNYGFQKTLLTTSCTDALEMAAILLNIKKGDEVIMPSYTFVSTANAFLLRGATVKFADSTALNPNICIESIKSLISKKTRAIVIVHYAGISSITDQLIDLCQAHDLYIIEDAAQAIQSKHDNIFLGSFGDLSAFSFHETKNINCGEGGVLVVNNEKFIDRADILWEKGTNRKAFFKGEIDKYGWVDIGSSFLLSEINAAYLFSQLENVSLITKHRLRLWHTYYEQLSCLVSIDIEIPNIPEYAIHNGHIFYLILRDNSERNKLISHLKTKNIFSVFHYQSLHKSKYYQNKFNQTLPHSDKYTERLLRLPLHNNLSKTDIRITCQEILSFFNLQFDDCY